MVEITRVGEISLTWGESLTWDDRRKRLYFVYCATQVLHGLHVVVRDAGTVDLLARYLDGMHGRANDATADGAGRLVTGTLTVIAGPGALWRHAAKGGWDLLT